MVLPSVQYVLYSAIYSSTFCIHCTIKLYKVAFVTRPLDFKGMNVHSAEITLYLLMLAYVKVYFFVQVSKRLYRMHA